jgi:hypothetical protein
LARQNETTAVRLDYGFADSQPQPCPVDLSRACDLMATKRRDHLVDVLWGDPDAGIVHGNGDFPVRSRGYFHADATA